MPDPSSILVTGATGFIGSHLCARLVAGGHDPRALVRPGARHFGHLGGFRVAPVQADLGDAAALEAACAEVDTVIHLIGFLAETRRNTFAEVVVAGTRRLVEAARRAGVRRFLYVSALGVERHADLPYFRTKGAAEQIVRDSGLEWLVLRAAAVYGPRSAMITAMQRIARAPLAVPILGDGRSRFQPLYIDDLTAVIARALQMPDEWNRTHEVAGPEVLTYEEMTDAFLAALGLRRRKLHLPWWLLRLIAALPGGPITPGVLAALRREMLCDIGPLVAAFGVQPRSFAAGVRATLATEGATR